MIDWNAIGTAVATVTITAGTILGGAWAWWLKNKRNQADTRADVAESNAIGTVADSQQIVYKQLSDRIAMQEARINSLDARLDTALDRAREAESRVHALEMYVLALKAELRRHDIDVPAPLLLSDLLVRT